MKNPHKLFEEYLNTHEGRYTPQKKVIVEEIFKTRSHFEVENFIDKLRSDDHKFSRATVYRTIKQLLDAGLIQKISTRDGKVFYERNFSKKQHDHLICNVCGKILEIKEDQIGEQLDQMCQQMGFFPEYRSIHIYGVCAKCHKKRTAET